MLYNIDIKRLLSCFPNSFINSNFEFIADVKSNTYFILKDCESVLDIQCKVLEWLSRSACKTLPYRSIKKNIEFHAKMLKGINDYLHTDFTEKEMLVIYTYLGNCCNHNRTLQFIEDYEFDMSFFK